MDLTDLHAALERHHARDGEGIVCAVCAEWWPCDAARALEEIDRLGLALHVARREDITRADAAEAQVAALLQDKAAAHARAEEREAELDLAIAHDRQLYPTAALDRVERAEAYGEWADKRMTWYAALFSIERVAEAVHTRNRTLSAFHPEILGAPRCQCREDAAALHDALLKETT